jgi:gliding motility-associated lipoprotein GldH
MKTLPWTAALIAVACLQGCSSHWHEADRSFDGGCWAVGDTITLEFDSPDTQQVYRLQFPVTISEDYSFNNIYLHADLVAPSGDVSMIPTEFKLCSPAGEWFAEASGDEIPFELNVDQGLRFNQTGKYKLKLYHFMRDDLLCGVQKAGIAIDPVKD